MNKIKILHILDSLCIGGMENLVIDICNNLDKSKYDICILCLSSDDLTQRSRLNKDIKLISLQFSKEKIKSPLYLLTHSLEIAKEIRKESPLIVHTHIYQCRLSPLLLSIKIALKNFSHFHTIHTSGIHYNNNNPWHKIKLLIERVCYKYFKTNLIAVSDNVYKKCYPLLKNSYSLFMTINNGVDLKKFDYNAFKKQNDDSFFNIIYVSRLHPGKNHNTLLKAVKLLSTKYSFIRLHIVGDGILHEEINQYIIDNKLSKYVTMHGNRLDVETILSKCQLGVFPSEYEGLSIALLEMMAMRLPIVCSDIPSFRNLLVDDKYALFFNTFDYENLAICIEKMLLFPNVREKYAQASYEIASRYSLSSMIINYEKFYTNIK